MDTPISDSLLLPHSYGTRKNHNAPIRPSARLRSSPEPTLPPSRRPRSSPDPSNHPQFPPTHVVLHPDDANSKVLLAIGRAFLSVDNRAMTIKDLAEMVLNFGLVAQNVSAASQAITTYIRTHLLRCDDQQDIPLLLRHVLSGTDSDDDLLPALYSRTGGAHCSAHPENRVTNFRRGTMVWYLSRATGASCPFARAGIRLSDYGENGKVGQPGNVVREKKRAKMLQRHENDQTCGQKRKRSLRSCAVAVQNSASESETDHDKPPPKVKLTLRLKPLAKCSMSSSPPSSSTQAPVAVRNIIDLTQAVDPSSSSSSDLDSSMSVVDDSDQEPQLRSAEPLQRPEDPPFCPPPYPRRSISIPPYTPSSNDEPYSSYSTTSQLYRGPYRRSPSLPNSISSPPPESDDEEPAEEDETQTQIPMIRSRRNFYSFSDDDDDEDNDDWDEEGEVDSEADGETLWESPGPRSPSAPLNAPPLPDTRVKEEPRNVQGMLDAWDHFDSSVADAKVVEVIAQAAAVLNPDTIGGSLLNAASRVKVEPQDPWDWEPSLVQQHEWTLGMAEDTIRIKQEELDFGIDSLFPSVGEDSFDLEDERLSQDGEDTMPTMRQRAKTAPLSQHHLPSPFSDTPSPSGSSVPPHTIRTTISTESIYSDSHSLTLPPPMSPGATALVQLIQALSVQSPTTPTAGCFPPPSDPPAQPSLAPISPSVPPSSLVLSPPSPSPPAQECYVSPQAIKNNSDTPPPKGEAEGIVVRTCQPCNPSISATQIEEISVYQMALGPYLLLRRIDTDFVNLTPIVEWCGKSRGYPVLSMIPNAVVITRGWGSEKILGLWVPLGVAQTYVKDLDTHSTGTAKDEAMEGLNVFLADDLVDRFPSALKDFHRTNSSGRMLKQFGRWFESMITFARAQAAAVTTGANNTLTQAPTVAVPNSSPLNPQKVIQAEAGQSWLQKDTVIPVPLTGAFALGAALGIGEREKYLRQELVPHQYQHRRFGSGKEDCLDVVSPLSAKEEEIFQELCVIPGEEEEKLKLEVKMGGMEVEAFVEKREEEEEEIPNVAVSSKGGVTSVNGCAKAAVECRDVKLEPFEVSEAPVQSLSPTLSHGSEESPAPKVKPAVTKTRATRAATMSKVTEKQVKERQEAQQSLRRSKRVADALAAQTQQQKTRSRKRPGSRNTLS